MMNRVRRRNSSNEASGGKKLLPTATYGNKSSKVLERCNSSSSFLATTEGWDHCDMLELVSPLAKDCQTTHIDSNLDGDDAVEVEVAAHVGSKQTSAVSPAGSLYQASHHRKLMKFYGISIAEIQAEMNRLKSASAEGVSDAKVSLGDATKKKSLRVVKRSGRPRSRSTGDLIFRRNRSLPGVVRFMKPCDLQGRPLTQIKRTASCPSFSIFKTLMIASPAFKNPSSRMKQLRLKSCLKKPDSLEKLLLKATESLQECRNDEKALRMHKMKVGSWLTKYDANGMPAERFVRISSDDTELRWGKRNNRASSSLILARVRGIVFGPRTKRFIRYDWTEGKPWLCFSLICDHRSYDFACSNSELFMLWFMGLQQVVPLSYDFLNLAQVHWNRAVFKTIQLSRRTGVRAIEIWRLLEIQAKNELREEKIKFLIVSIWEQTTKRRMLRSLRCMTETAKGEIEPFDERKDRDVLDAQALSIEEKVINRSSEGITHKVDRVDRKGFTSALSDVASV